MKGKYNYNNPIVHVLGVQTVNNQWARSYIPNS